MRPILVIGLGNSLMGDDGVGCLVARALAEDPRLPDTVEVIAGGTDLLRYAARMEGRERIIVVDAIASGDLPGRIEVFRDALPADAARRHCHDLSAIDAIQLLRRCQGAPILLVTVSIASADAGTGLSAPLTASLPPLLDRLVLECRRPERTPASIADSDVL